MQVYTRAHVDVRACDPRVPRARVRAAGLGARSGAIIPQRTAAPHPPGSQAGPRGPPGLRPSSSEPRLPSHASLRAGRRERAARAARAWGCPAVAGDTSPGPVRPRSAGEGREGPVPGWCPPLTPSPGPLPRAEGRLPSAAEAAGCRAQAQRPVEAERRRRKRGEGERVARGRGNSRLRRANGNGWTRWHQIPFGQ